MQERAAHGKLPKSRTGYFIRMSVDVRMTGKCGYSLVSRAGLYEEGSGALRLPSCSRRMHLCLRIRTVRTGILSIFPQARLITPTSCTTIPPTRPCPLRPPMTSCT